MGFKYLKYNNNCPEHQTEINCVFKSALSSLFLYETGTPNNMCLYLD